MVEIREKRPPFLFKSGAVYEGEWKGNMRDGNGIQTWPDKAKYEGGWKENKAHGQGKFWHVDGDIFEGEYNTYSYFPYYIFILCFYNYC